MHILFCEEEVLLCLPESVHHVSVQEQEGRVYCSSPNFIWLILP